VVLHPCTHLCMHNWLRPPSAAGTDAAPGRAAPGPAAARPAHRPLPGPRYGGAGAACVIGACLAHRTTSFAFCSPESGGAKSASLRMYSSRRCLYLSSRCCSASVISRLAIRSPAPGRSRPADSSTMNRRVSPGHGVPPAGRPRTPDATTSRRVGRNSWSTPGDT